MQFTQIEFLLFFLATSTFVNFIGNTTVKKVLILCGSLYFYAYFDYRILLLLLFSILSTSLIAKQIYTSQDILIKRILLQLGLLINISILVAFKYMDFFIDSINATFGKNINLTHLNIILPIGISFFTFRFTGYLIDIYKNKYQPISLFDFTIYGSFFPIIISGPISRADFFSHQLLKIENSTDKAYNGYRLFVIGLFLKVFVADKIAFYVNFFYENHSLFDVTTTWLAVLSYSIQIYCDFAGYSSMAIGLALIMGLQIEENFNFPYLSLSVSDFWKKWHITLSSWIRDYLYIPLGGSKKGELRRAINLLIAMSLCGLWHGAAWTFVAWGFMHGVLLIINHTWKKSGFDAIKNHIPTVYSLLSWSLTFVSVTICWILFRSNSFKQATEIVTKLFSIGSPGVHWIHPFVIFIVSSFVIIHLLTHFKVEIVNLPIKGKLTPTILFCMIWLVIVFFPKEFQPFVYAQF